MGYDEEKMRAIYDEEHKKEMKLDKYYSENFQELKDRLIEEDAFLSYVINSKYREVKISKDRWDFIIIEWKIDFPSQETNFDNLQKKYPNADIQATNYEGTLMKYTVTEKIKLDKFM